MEEREVQEYLVNGATLGVFLAVIVMAVCWGISDVNHPYPRTPADWKAGYEAALKDEQARHAEAMGGEKK